MRIALYHNMPTGGSRRLIYEHCRLLSASGHEVVVYQPSEAEQGFLDLRPVVHEVVTVPYEWRTLTWHGVIGTVPDLSRLYHEHERLSQMQRHIASLIAARGFDLAYVHLDQREVVPSLLRFLRPPSVFYCNEPGRPYFEAPLVAEGGAAPTAETVNDLLLRALFSRQPAAEIYPRFRRLQERTNVLNATVLVANSAYSGESLLRAYGRVSRRVRPAVNPDFFTPSDQPREDFLLSVGGFWPEKGFRFLLRAMALLPEGLRLPLVLIGDRAREGELEVLQELAARLGIPLTTHLRLRDDELRELYRRCRLFVYAPYLEPLGLAPLEAMACGAPVLGVREGGVRETVCPGVSGWLVDRDERAMAAALTELLSRPEQLDEISGRARDYVLQHWTWEQSLTELLPCFEEALAAGPRGCR